MNEKQKQEIIRLSPLFALFLCMACILALYLHTYGQMAFEQLSAFCEMAVESAPELEPQLLSALKEYSALTGREIHGNRYLEQYGYGPNGFSKGLPGRAMALSSVLFLVVACIFLLAGKFSVKREKERIDGLTKYLEQVNIGAGGTLIQVQEDAFSHLQDEIYKTVTMLYQTREAAVDAKKRFAENLENIAHQLKTPITAASLSLQLMEKEAPAAHIRQVGKQLGRLNRLEEALLTLSKIDAGTLPLKHERVDIYTALCLAAENLDALLGKEQVSVNIPDKGCVEFPGDLEWTMEALANLLKNCLEHSKPGGQIYCDYVGNPLYAEILVWDEGAGFSLEDIPHLFERFYRGKNAAPGGIGIGLALAQSLFELQNGTVTARNLEDGGACFEIRIYSH